MTETIAKQSKKLSQEINKRMGEILKTPLNQKCADCPVKRPLWASFLVSPIEEDKQIGVLICQECAQYHLFELGEGRTMIKYLKMAHEWTEHDVEVLEDTGNEFCNAFYEAKLSDRDFQKDLVVNDAEEEEIRRSNFVKRKYKKLKFFDEVIYHKEVLALLQRRHNECLEDNNHKEVSSLLQRRPKERLEKEKKERRRRSSRGRNNNSSSSCSIRESSRSRNWDKRRSSSRQDSSRSLTSSKSGHGSTRSRTSRTKSGNDSYRRESSSERRSSYQKVSSSDRKKERTSSHKSSRPVPERTPSTKLKDLRSTCRERQRGDRRELLQKASSVRLPRPSSKKGDELSSNSAHTPRGNSMLDGNKSSGGGSRNSLNSLSGGAKAIEIGFMASLGMGSSIRSSPVVHVGAMDPFLSENEDGPRRRTYGVLPDYNCQSNSDNEGVAVPLRRRLSDRKIAAAEASGRAVTPQMPPTRLQRRLSDKQIMAKAEGDKAAGNQSTLRRRLSSPNLMTSAAPTDTASRLRIRLSNSKLSTNETPESGQQQPRMRRKLSNRNLTGMCNDSPDGAPAANGQQPRIRRNLSNKNLMGNAPLEGGGQPQVRRGLSNSNLMANDQSGGGQPKVRRRFSNRDLMEDEQPQVRRRLSNKNIMANGPPDQEAGAAGCVLRRRLSNRNLMANAGAESTPEYGGVRRRGSNRNLMVNTPSQGEAPEQSGVKGRLSRCNILDEAIAASDARGPRSDAQQPIQQRLRRRNSNPDLLANDSSEDESATSPAEPCVRRRLSNRNLKTSAPSEKAAANGKAPPAQPGVRRRRPKEKQLVGASDADESEMESNQRMQRRLSNRSLKAAPEHGGQQQPKKMTRKRSGNNLLGKCANGPPLTAGDAEESDAESVQPVRRSLSNKSLKSSAKGGQKPKRMTRKRSDPDLLGMCVNGPPVEDPLVQKRVSYTKSLMAMVAASDTDSESDEERRRFLESYAPTSPSTCPSSRESEEERRRFLESYAPTNPSTRPSSRESEEERRRFLESYAPTSPSTCPSSRSEEEMLGQ